jgi:hypothetical protein
LAELDDALAAANARCWSCCDGCMCWVDHCGSAFSLLELCDDPVCSRSSSRDCSFLLMLSGVEADDEVCDGAGARSSECSVLLMLSGVETAEVPYDWTGARSRDCSFLLMLSGVEAEDDPYNGIGTRLAAC